MSIIRKSIRVLRFLKSKSNRSIYIFLWILITFIVIIPIWCRTYPKWCNPQILNKCGYVKPSDSELDQENLYRTDLAERILSKIGNDQQLITNWNNVNASNLTIGVIAKRRPYLANEDRPSLKYLTQVASKLLEFVDASCKSEFKCNLFVCNIDGEPDVFAEAWDLSRYVPIVQKTRDDSGKHTNSDDILDKVLDQERSDYAFCLRQSLDKTLDNGYVLLVEDDALPVDNFGSMLYSIISQLDHRRHRYAHDQRDQSSVFVKLYHPEVYRKIPWLIFAFLYSFLLAFLFYVLIHFQTKYRLINSRRPLLISALIFLYFSAVLWCCGHFTVANIRYYLSGKSVYMVIQESCCTPAVLYERNAATKVAQYLDDRIAHNGYALDHMLDEMSTVTGLMTDMNIVRHIGRYSTLRPKPVAIDLW